MKRIIWVRFDRVGFHSYPSAPDEVAYLRSRHRHLFKFEVAVEVYENDREIEFHMFQSFVLNYIDTSMELNNKSCEMLAEDIITIVAATYRGRDISVTVSEDGECGATLTHKVNV